MTQKEFDAKMTEIREIYNNRAHDLRAALTPKITELETKQLVVKEEYEKVNLKLREEYAELVYKENELRRKGYAHYSEEVEAVRRQKDDNKFRQKGLYFDFENKMHALKLEFKKATAELAAALHSNNNMRNKAKREVAAQMQS